jgi:hypothetical protein
MPDSLAETLLLKLDLATQSRRGIFHCYRGNESHRVGSKDFNQQKAFESTGSLWSRIKRIQHDG